MRGDFSIIASMPKRSRTSHIPAQIRRRKARRPNDFTSALAESQAFRQLAEDEAAIVPATPVATPRMGRRLEAATRSREGYVGRTVAGQLPTFERAYLVRELTQIAVISGSLLLLLIVLWVVMR
jgi:hypothetical protein